jgi:outer membrane receptor for ferrienterochelin and colicins
MRLPTRLRPAQYVSPLILAGVAVCGLASPLHADDAKDRKRQRDLGQLNLEQLMEIKVEGASLHSQGLEDAPASVTLITQADIRKFGYRSLAEALSDVRGFFTTYDHIYHFQGVRGFELPGDYGTRLLLLINGHNMTDNILGQSVWFGQDFPLDMNLIKRIEIIRGPSSALYGSNGIFATINVVTFSPEESVGTRVRSEFDSFGGRKLQAASSVAIGHGATLLLSASALAANGDHSIYVPAYDSPATNLGRAVGVDGERGYHLFGNLTWHDWSVSALFGGREKNQVISWGQTVFNDPATRSIDTPNFVDATYTRNFDTSRSLQWRSYYNSYRFLGTFRYPLENGSVDNQQRFLGDWIGSQLSYRFALPRFGSLTLGATGQFDVRSLMQSIDVTPVHLEHLSIDKRDRSAAVFAQDEWNFAPRWTVSGGVRFDYSRYRHDFVSPRAALIYQPSSRSSYKLLYGKAFRNPTAFELFYNDLEAQTIGNSEAQSEAASTVEFVVERKLAARLNGLVSVYRYGIDGLLVGNYTADGLLQYSNADAVRASGVEFELNGQPAPWLDVVTSLAIQRAVKTAHDSRLPNSPAEIGKVRVSVPLFHSGLWVANSLQYMGSRQTLAGVTLPPVLLSDIVVSSNRLTSNLDFQVGVRNVGNVRYSDPIALNSRVDTLTVPGRSLFASFTWQTQK